MATSGMSILAILLSVCLAFAGIAGPGYQLDVTADVQGENALNISAKVLEDEDGCLQLELNGDAQGSPLDVFLQLGKQALVIGSDGEYMQIDYDTLIAAAEQALDRTLTDEQKLALGLIYYAFTGLKDDADVFEDVLENELSRILTIAMSAGIITYTREALTIEANQDQLFELFKAYVKELANDTSVFAALSTTKLWSLLSLSANGENEQAYVKTLAEQIDYVGLPDAYTFSIKVVIGMTDETVSAEMAFATKDGNTDLVYTAYVTNDTVNMNLNGVIEGVNTEMTVDANESGAVIKVDMDGNGTTLKINETITVNGAEVDVNADLDLYVGYQNATVKASEKGVINLEDCYCDYTLNADIDVDGTSRYLKADATFDTVNGLYIGAETDIPNGQKNGLYIKGNAQATEYGAFVANLTVDALYNGVALDDMFALDISVTDVVNVSCHLNDYSEYSGRTNVFEFNFNLNLNNANLAASLTAEGQTLAINGVNNQVSYDMTATFAGQTVATASLELVQGMPFVYSLLLGTLTIDVPMAEVSIVREAKIDNATLAWVITYTERAQSQVIEVGIRDKSAGSVYNYEAYLASQGMEYNAGVVFSQNASAVNGELYVNLVTPYGAQSLIDVKATLTQINETGAHISGYPLPQEYLEQMIESVLKQVF